MVITELNVIEEGKRVATAAGQSKQCAWMNWEGAEARMDELGGSGVQDGLTGRELRPGWMKRKGYEARMDEKEGSWGQDGRIGRELRPGWMNWKGAEARMDELGGSWGQDGWTGRALRLGWMKWEGAEARKLSWSSLMTMQPFALSFLLHSTYNLLLTPANHKQSGFTGDDTCAMCKSARGAPQHILSTCGNSPQMYTWRHNQVLAILAELIENQCRVANEQTTQDPNPCISFLQEGEAPPRQVSQPQGQQFTAATRDWKMAADLKEALHFPYHIVYTQERPDSVIWFDTVKLVIIVELPVPWEENMEEALKRKKLCYENLRMECEGKGFCLPSDAHRGWFPWLHWSKNNLIPDQAGTTKEGQKEVHTYTHESPALSNYAHFKGNVRFYWYYLFKLQMEVSIIDSIKLPSVSVSRIGFNDYTDLLWWNDMNIYFYQFTTRVWYCRTLQMLWKLHNIRV